VTKKKKFYDIRHQDGGRGRLKIGPERS